MRRHTGAVSFSMPRDRADADAESVAQSRDRDLYMTARSRAYGVVLEAVDAGEPEQESDSVLVHLPGGVFVQVLALAQHPGGPPSRDEVDAAAVTAAEALL